MLGDFNHHYRSIGPIIERSTYLHTILPGYRQHAGQPTHQEANLDLAFSSSLVIYNLDVLPPLATSDHNMVSPDLPMRFVDSETPTVPDFKRQLFGIE